MKNDGRSMKTLHKAIEATKKRLPGFEVSEICDERQYAGDGDLLWVYFDCRGFSRDQCHSANGETIKQVIEDLKGVEPCDCEECLEYLAKA